MDHSTHWLCACVLLFMLLGASSYKTLTEDQVCSHRKSSFYLATSSGGSTLIELGPSHDQRICNISVEVSPLLYLLPAHAQVMLAVRMVPRDNLPLNHIDYYGTCNLQLKSKNMMQGRLGLCENSSLSQVLLINISQDPIIAYLHLPGNRDSLRASGILFNLVTRGMEACSKPGMVQCGNKMASTQQCVQPQLACDGLVNCPEDDSDEDKHLCHRDELPEVFAGKEQQMPYSQRREFYEREEFKFLGLTLLVIVLCISLILVLYCCGCINKDCTCPDPPMSPRPVNSRAPVVPNPTAIYIFRDGEVPSGSMLQRPTSVYVLKGNKAHVEATESTSSNDPTAPLISTQPRSPNLSYPQPMPNIHSQSDTYPVSPAEVETHIFPITPTAPSSSTYGVNHTDSNPLPHIGFCVPHVSPTLPLHDTYSMPSTNNEEELPPDYNSLFSNAGDKHLQGKTSSSPC